MAGQTFATGTRTNRVQLATGHAGERDGTNATDGAAGSASESVVKMITIACTDAATVKNTLRVYMNNNGTKSLIKSIPISEVTFVNGERGDMTADIPLMRKLPNANAKLAYCLEANMGMDITEEIVDF